ncbi:hypothetical protein Ae717Ps2_7227 [Pseudonocardia sp. Ae717_Ps2]|nr:hypothetical protein Ae717Ps2_7227 [Pseudonocardia sp. Ae717_Ps2]
MSVQAGIRLAHERVRSVRSWASLSAGSYPVSEWIRAPTSLGATDRAATRCGGLVVRGLGGQPIPGQCEALRYFVVRDVVGRSTVSIFESSRWCSPRGMRVSGLAVHVQVRGRHDCSN